MIPINFKLDNNGYGILQARLKREFSRRLSEIELIKAVDGCSDVKEAEQIAIKYAMCDYCDFTKLNLKTVIMLMKAVVKILSRYPKVRSRICFLGSKSGFLEALRNICLLDKEVIARFGIQKICADADLIDLASAAITLVDNTEYGERESNVLAQAFNLCGILDAVVLDEDDFRGLGYMRLCNQLLLNEQSGYHPKGCGDPSSVIYHEFGHMLDNLCKLTESREFLGYYNGLSKKQIEDGVSLYATVNAQELFAEAFAEYMCNDRPRDMSLRLGKMLDENYKNI